jgi:hypothetical protein
MPTPGSKERNNMSKFQYGTQYENGNTQLRKNLKEARWWARTLSTPNKKTGKVHPVAVVARPVGEWIVIEDAAE